MILYVNASSFLRTWWGISLLVGLVAWGAVMGRILWQVRQCQQIWPDAKWAACLERVNRQKQVCVLDVQLTYITAMLQALEEKEGLDLVSTASHAIYAVFANLISC